MKRAHPGKPASNLLFLLLSFQPCSPMATLKKQTPRQKSHQVTLWLSRTPQKHPFPGRTRCVHLWFSWLESERFCSCHLRQTTVQICLAVGTLLPAGLELLFAIWVTPLVCTPRGNLGRAPPPTPGRLIALAKLSQRLNFPPYFVIRGAVM